MAWGLSWSMAWAGMMGAGLVECGVMCAGRRLWGRLSQHATLFPWQWG